QRWPNGRDGRYQFTVDRACATLGFSACPRCPLCRRWCVVFDGSLKIFDAIIIEAFTQERALISRDVLLHHGSDLSVHVAATGMVHAGLGSARAHVTTPGRNEAPL